MSTLTPITKTNTITTIVERTGQSRQEAEAILSELMEANLITTKMNMAEIKAAIHANLAGTNILASSSTTRPDSDDLDDWGLGHDQPAAPKEEQPAPAKVDHEQPQQPQQNHGGRGQAVLMPNGGARLWRRVGDEDIEFFITPDTDMVALFDNLTALLDKTPKAAWIAAKEGDQPAIIQYRQFKIGEEVVLGIDNRINATPITSITVTSGPTKSWINFHDGTLAKTGKNAGMPVTIGRVEASAKAYEIIESAIGQRLGARLDNISAHVTLKLSNLGTEEKIIDGKKVRVSSNPSYVSSFYSEVLKVELL